MAAGEEDPSPFIALIPGDGWMIYRSHKRSGYSSPVLAWVLCKNSDVLPLEVDPSGIVFPVEIDALADLELWHPDRAIARGQQLAQLHRD